MGKTNKRGARSKAGSTSQKPIPVDSGYQPSKAELEADVSLPVSPERLMRAVVAGGAPRQEK